MMMPPPCFLQIQLLLSLLLFAAFTHAGAAFTNILIKPPSLPPSLSLPLSHSIAVASLFATRTTICQPVWLKMKREASIELSEQGRKQARRTLDTCSEGGAEKEAAKEEGGAKKEGAGKKEALKDQARGASQAEKILEVWKYRP